MEEPQEVNKDQKTIDNFIKDAQINAKAMILAAKIKRVVTNVAIGLLVVGAIVGAIVVVGAIEQNANQQPKIEDLQENQETPVQE